MLEVSTSEGAKLFRQLVQCSSSCGIRKTVNPVLYLSIVQFFCKNNYILTIKLNLRKIPKSLIEIFFSIRFIFIFIYANVKNHLLYFKLLTFPLCILQIMLINYATYLYEPMYALCV